MKSTNHNKQPSWIVGPESVRMIELGHPWIIADSYTKRWPAGKPGQLIELTDEKGRFLATGMLDPNERVVARLLGRKRISIDKGWITSRLRPAIDIRLQHAKLAETTAYRLVNAEGDGLPGITVDRYDTHLMLQLYSEAWRPHLPALTSVLNELLSPAGIYEKVRPQNTRELEANSENKKYGRLISGKPAKEPMLVKENGISFWVSLEKGLNTGLFLDQRRNRIDLMERVKGKRVLNLFSYTGAFSVAAAAAGATEVTSVDVSQGYTDWAIRNFELNRINPRQHRFLVGDCLQVLKQLNEQRKRFDVVLMDPPSFSTTSKGRFTTKGGTSDLLAAASAILVDGGLMICSSNHQKVDLADYIKELRKGALQAGCELRVISTLGQPEDFPYPTTFPEGRYLKYLIMAKIPGGVK